MDVPINDFSNKYWKVCSNINSGETTKKKKIYFAQKTWINLFFSFFSLIDKSIYQIKLIKFDCYTLSKQINHARDRWKWMLGLSSFFFFSISNSLSLSPFHSSCYLFINWKNIQRLLNIRSYELAMTINVHFCLASLQQVPLKTKYFLSVFVSIFLINLSCKDLTYWCASILIATHSFPHEIICTSIKRPWMVLRRFMYVVFGFFFMFYWRVVLNGEPYELNIAKRCLLNWKWKEK